jgi:type VI secretion system protein ImpH
MTAPLPLPVLDAPDPLAAVIDAPVPDTPPSATPSAPAGAEALLAELRRAPQSFGFFAIMRLLEARYRDRPRFGRSVRPEQDPLRLGQEPSVTHAPASLADFEPGADGRAHRLLVHFFGLFGPDGPLPLHLTEFARDRRRNHGDATFQRFADLFHHRALSLFYRAWADVRPTVSFDRPDQDRFSDYIGALIGLSTPGLRGRDAMPDLTKLHFAGLLSAQTRPAEGLAQMLSAFFAMPVRLEGFCGVWLGLPDGDRTRLSGGAETAELGKTALLGARVWSRQHKFRVVFGPLGLAEYERLLPGGLSFHRLVPIVRNYAGDALIWDVNLILRADEVPAIRLGRQGRLGWTTWLMPRRARTDAADLFLDASADSHASEIVRKSGNDAAEGAAP